MSNTDTNAGKSTGNTTGVGEVTVLVPRPKTPPLLWVKQPVIIELPFNYYLLLKELNERVKDVFFSPCPGLLNRVVVHDKSLDLEKFLKEALEIVYEPLDHAERQFDCHIGSEKNGNGDFISKIFFEYLSPPGEKQLAAMYTVLADFQKKNEMHWSLTGPPPPKPHPTEEMMMFRGIMMPRAAVEAAMKADPTIKEWNFTSGSNVKHLGKK